MINRQFYDYNICEGNRKNKEKKKERKGIKKILEKNSFP